MANTESPDFEELWAKTKPEGIGPSLVSSIRSASEIVWNMAIDHACERVFLETDVSAERIAEIKQDAQTS